MAHLGTFPGMRACIPLHTKALSRANSLQVAGAAALTGSTCK
jgi:hypothetical protein